ncbi:hypothetical protein BKA80DRAFT_311909 [Phyllosticta citrichinensis]
MGRPAFSSTSGRPLWDRLPHPRSQKRITGSFAFSSAGCPSNLASLSPLAMHLFPPIDLLVPTAASSPSVMPLPTATLRLAFLLESPAILERGQLTFDHGPPNSNDPPFPPRENPAISDIPSVEAATADHNSSTKRASNSPFRVRKMSLKILLLFRPANLPAGAKPSSPANGPLARYTGGQLLFGRAPTTGNSAPGGQAHKSSYF